MIIVVQKKTVYGRDLFYPVCDKAKLFASIVGQKTLPDDTLRLIQELGYEITLEAERFKFG